MKKIIKYFSFALMLVLSVSIFAGCFGGNGATPITYNEFAEYVNSNAVVNVFTSYHYESTQKGLNQSLGVQAEVKLSADVKFVGENISLYAEMTFVNGFEIGTKNYKVYLYNDKLYVDNGVERYWFEYDYISGEYYDMPESELNEIDTILYNCKINVGSDTPDAETLANIILTKEENGDVKIFNLTMRGEQELGFEEKTQYLDIETSITYNSNVIRKYFQTSKSYEDDILLMEDTRTVEAKEVNIPVPTVALYTEYQA